MFGFRRRSTLVPLGHPPRQRGGIFGVGRRGSEESDVGAIHRAARAGSVWKVKQLLFFGKSRLHDRDGMSRTALHVACACGHPKVVTLLIERNCLLDLCDSKNRTALIQALEYQQEECAAILLDHGADPDIRDINGNTALHYAVLGQSKAIVEKLLLHEADMNARNKDGCTPLALAKRENRHQMVELLIRRGAKDDHIESNQQLSTENEGERQSVKCSERSDHDQEECLVEEIRITNSTTDLQESSDKASRRRNSRRDLKKCFVEVISVTSSSRDLQESSDKASRRRNSRRDLKKCFVEVISVTSSSRDLQESSDKASRRRNSRRDLQESSEEASRRSNSKRGLLQCTKKGIRRPSSKRDLLQSTEEAVRRPSSKRDLLQSTEEAVRRPSSKRDLLQSTEEAVRKPSSKRDLLQSTEAAVKRPSSKRGLLQSTKKAIRRPSSRRDLQESSEETSRRSDSKRDLLQSKKEAIRIPSSKRVLQGSSKEVLRKTDSQRGGESSEEDSLRRLSSKPGINDSVPISHHEDFKGEVISNICTLTAKTAENQSKQIHLPTLHLEKMSQDSEINRACDGEYTSAYSGHPSVQKDEEMWLKHGKFKQRKNLQLTSDKLKQKRHEFCEKGTSECPEEGPLHHSKKGASIRQMPSNLTNKILDCGGKDAFGMPLSEVFQTFPGGEEPTLKNVFPSHSRSGSPEGSPWSSSSELCLSEKELHSENDHKPDTEHVLNKNEEPFCSDTENIKGRNPVVTSKVKEDQEFDMQMTKNMNPNTTNRKLGVRHTPQPSGLKSHLDLQIASHSEKNHMIQIKRNDTYAVTNTYKETKPNQGLLQKPLYADHCSASNYNKSMESEIQEWSSSYPYSVGTPTGCETEALEQDVQRLNMDMSKAELLALRKRGRSSSDNLSVSDRYEKEESLLPVIHKLLDEIAVLRMEVDAVKNENREMENKCLKYIAIAKEKNDHLQKTTKMNEETLTKTIFQYNGQLAALRAQNAMLNSKLENEKQNRERLEAEVESCRPRLATALQDREQCPTSKKDLQLGCQRRRDEWFSFRDKMNLDMSDLKERNEILSQQLSKAESKLSSLEIELHHTRDAPRERTLVLEGAERDLSKTKGGKTEIEHVYQSEQCKVNKHIAEQESLREKLRQLQSENMLLRQQLDDAHSQADSNKKTVVTILDPLQEVRKIFPAEHDINELTNEWHHLKERIYKHENDNAEDAVVRQLEQDLADTKKKLSMLEASQKVESPYRMNLEDEKKKLKKELDESRSQIQHEKKHIRKWAELKSPLQSCLREVLKKTGELEKELTRFKEILNITQRKLNEHENEELSFPEDLEQSLTEMEIQTNMLKQKNDDFLAILEPASSPCAHVDEENTLQQALPSVKAIQKKCEKLEDKKEKWKQKAKMLEKQMEMKMSEIDQYKQMIGTRAAQDLREKLEQVQLLLKLQSLPQEDLQELSETNKASLRRGLELIVQDLESGLSILEEHDQLHQRENQCAKSLSSQLVKTKEKMAEVKNELLRQKQQER